MTCGRILREFPGRCFLESLHLHSYICAGGRSAQVFRVLGFSQSLPFPVERGKYDLVFVGRDREELDLFIREQQKKKASNLNEPQFIAMPYGK